jgi:uncharacterized membrane protein (GlpM family)
MHELLLNKKVRFKMNMIELLIRFLVGGSLIALVSLLANTKYSVISGLFVLFPIVTLVGFFFIGNSVDSSRLHEITRFSIYSLSTTFIFLYTFYHLQIKYKLIESLFLSVIAWFLAAGILILINHYVLQIGKS